MIQITDKKRCCGCSACATRCPRHCITMNVDAEGFFYPEVNEAECIQCGLCEKACPFIEQNEPRYPLSVYAAKNKDEETVRQSSSGGVFTALAEQVISKGGVVFGVRFDKSWQAVFDHTDDIEGLSAFRGSKYVQANVGNAFAEARDFLKAGRQVLFSGTPCQVAALHRFLQRDYDNLLTVDFICHGVPSPKVWQRYLKEITQNARHAISDIQFRNKQDGWKRFNFVIDYDEASDHYHLSSWHKENHYMRIFLNDVILRPSCYDCNAKGGRSGSDMTIADFWGIAHWHPELDDDKGINALLINTSKGTAFLNQCELNKWESSREKVLSSNPALIRSAKRHPRRSQFFSRLDDSESVTRLIDDTLRITLGDRLRRFPRRMAVQVYLLLRRLTGGGNSILATSPTIYESPFQKTIVGIDEKQIEEFCISNVCFRSKYSGWKRYNMEIELGYSIE